MKSTIFIPNVGYIAAETLEKLITCCNGHSCVIWGAGNTGLKYKRILDYCGISLTYMVDCNSDKQGLILSGAICVYAPSHIEGNYDKSTIFLLAIQSPQNRYIVTEQLRDLGVSDRQIYPYELSYTLGDFPGFDVFLGTSKLEQGEVFTTYQNITDSSPIKIAILGSSTTTDENHGYLCWPRQLFNIMQSNHISCVIFNGGTEAYISSQSFFKLVRDVLTLSPDIIIEYGGINDACEDFVDLEHPLVCRQLSNRAQKMLEFYNNNRKPHLKKSLYKGLPAPSNRADIWYKNQRMMHAIAQEFDIPFFSFLEPTIYSGQYQLSLSEQEAISDDMLIGMKYKERAQNFYSAGKLYTADTAYIYDLTGLFDGLSGILIDDRHCNNKGTSLIAERIFQVIKETSDGLL